MTFDAGHLDVVKRVPSPPPSFTKNRESEFRPGSRRSAGQHLGGTSTADRNNPVDRTGLSNADFAGTRHEAVYFQENHEDWAHKRISAGPIFENILRHKTAGFKNTANVDYDQTESQADSLLDPKSDIFYAWEEDNFFKLSTQLAILDQKLQEMSSTRTNVDTQNLTLINENKSLVKRISILEEQLREEEQQHRRDLDQERENFEAKTHQLKVAHNREFEEIREMHHQVEIQNAVLLAEANKSKLEIDRLRFENLRLQERVDEGFQNYQSTLDEMIKQRESMKKKVDGLKRDRDALLKHFEEQARIQTATNVLTGRCQSPGDCSETSRPAMSDLQSIIQRLTLDNSDLQEQLEEARSELVIRSLDDGRRLLYGDNSGVNFDRNEDLDALSSNDLKKYLIKERDISAKFHEYVENILGRILEKDPSLLESNNYALDGLNWVYQITS